MMMGNGFLPQIHGGNAQWWSNNGAIAGCLAAYQPKGAESLAASYGNLANPGTYNATPGVAPTWSAINGWTFNGTTQYLTTTLLATTAKSMIVRFSNASGATICAAGTATVGVNDRFAIFPAVGTNHAYGYSGLNSVSPNLTSGIMAISQNDCYLNGVADGVTIGSTVINTAIYIGGRNVGGAVDLLLNGNIQALAIYSVALSPTEIATLTALMSVL